MKLHEITRRSIQLEKGLTKEQAWKKARAKPGRDFRGMKYNPRTGKCILT